MANVNGWSEYSDISYIYAFSAPDKPPSPQYVSGTDTSVTLSFQPSRNDNGIRVSNYELYIDQGDDTTSDFTQLVSYSSFKLEHTLTVATDSLGSPGTIYRVKLLAVNEESIKSEFSNELLFRLGALPSQPLQVFKNDQLSAASQIYVEWTKL